MTPHAHAYAQVAEALQDYFDGLYHGDTQRLGRVLHPQAVYATAVPAEPLVLRMDEYLPIVAARPSPASRGEARRDRVLSIGFAGPVTAMATVECSIGPKDYTDLLTLIRADGAWRIIAKVFHYETRPPLTPGTST